MPVIATAHLVVMLAAPVSLHTYWTSPLLTLTCPNQPDLRNLLIVCVKYTMHRSIPQNLTYIMLHTYTQPILSIQRSLHSVLCTRMLLELRNTFSEQSRIQQRDHEIITLDITSHDQVQTRTQPELEIVQNLAMAFSVPPSPSVLSDLETGCSLSPIRFTMPPCK